MSEDVWRVDVAGYPVNVRGYDAYLHIQSVNHKMARMKLALHKINNTRPDQCPGDCIEDAYEHLQTIAREALS